MNQYTPLVIFDGVCNLCEGTVHFIIKRDSPQHFYFSPIQSPYGQQLLQQYGLNQEAIETVVLVKDGQAYTKSTAALEIARHLDNPWPLLHAGKIIPTFIRDTIYDFIARHRYRWFGHKETCMIPTPELRARFITSMSDNLTSTTSSS